MQEEAIQLLEDSVKTFRADSMQDALVRVRRELGPDALIVHTRQVEVPPRFPWQKTKTVTEILAANLPDTPPPGFQLPKAVNQEPAPVSKPANPPEVRAKSAASRLLEKEVLPGKSEPDQVSLDFSPQAKSALQFGNQKNLSKAPVEKTPVKIPPVAVTPELNRNLPKTEIKVPEVRNNSNSENNTKKLEERLVTLERMISHLTKQLQQQDWTELTPEWAPLYDQLTTAEVESKLARDLIHELKKSSHKLPMRNLEQKKLALKGLISSKLKCKAGLKLTPGKRTIAALIGPTGVGKTTTLAKLAASFTLRQGLKIGLITIDTYRIAAVDQLRTYAEIISIPMQVVSSQKELQQALKEYAHYDLVLIDTAGRSPHDESKVNELKMMLSGIQLNEIFLVMSAVSSMSNLEHTLNIFSPLGTTSLIFTKLDEHSHKGQILNLLTKTNMPISYVTTGQDVPHDISPAEASMLASLVF